MARSLPTRSSMAWAWPSRRTSRSCSAAVSGRAARPVTSSARPRASPCSQRVQASRGCPARARATAKEGSGELPVVSAASSPFAPQPGLFVTRRGRGPGPQGVVVLALAVERPGQVVVAGGGEWVVLAQGLEADRQGAAVHRLGLGVLALGTEGPGQVVVAECGVGVVLAQGLELDRQGTAVHRLGLGVLPLGTEGRGQVVVAGGGFGVVLAQDVSTDREIFLEEERGLGVLAAGIELSRPGFRLPRLHVAILDLTGQSRRAAGRSRVPGGRRRSASGPCPGCVRAGRASPGLAGRPRRSGPRRGAG